MPSTGVVARCQSATSHQRCGTPAKPASITDLDDIRLIPHVSLAPLHHFPRTCARSNVRQYAFPRLWYCNCVLRRHRRYFFSLQRRAQRRREQTCGRKDHAPHSLQYHTLRIHDYFYWRFINTLDYRGQNYKKNNTLKINLDLFFPRRPHAPARQHQPPRRFCLTYIFCPRFRANHFGSSFICPKSGGNHSEVGKTCLRFKA